MNFDKFYNIVKQYSITSNERIRVLYSELEHIRISNIEGDLVECGVYKGGNILGMMEYCYYFNLDKKIWIYDTFKGMTKPTTIDVDLNNISAVDQWDNIVCMETLGQVKKNLSVSLYTNIQYVIGDVCETLQNPDNIPGKISLLRLDTDWFESTMCELNILFPNLEKDGSLIIDDYGHWKGCKIAVDSYFKNTNYEFEKIDYTGICLRK